MLKLSKIRLFLWTLSMVMFISLTACVGEKESTTKELWGEVDGQSVFLYTITNAKGMQVQLSTYGGIITSALVPDKNGKLDDVVLGFDNLQQYIDDSPNFGATIGRFANRIRHGKFSIDEKEYQLTLDKWGHTLHGGDEYAKAVWEAKEVKTELGLGVELHYYSQDGTHGFPGNLDSYVTYTLTNENAIHVKFEATTDMPTHVNMTQHSYFNLNGGQALIYDHLVQIDAETYTEFDDQVLPTGRILPLKGTAWDLTQMTRLSDKIDRIPLNGYHHCYVLKKESKELNKVVKVEEPNSGRTLEVSTTQPGVVFYAANVLSDKTIGKYGIRYQPHAGFCIETQHFPDAPNHPNFPSTLLLPDKKYEEVVIYDFGILDE